MSGNAPKRKGSPSGPLEGAALAMAARGWRVFPVEPRGKRPAGALAPHGLLDATCDLETVRGWWEREPEANIGLATGRESGVVVIDLDGEAAELAYGTLLAAHGNPGSTERPDGAVARTGSGWHLYFHPGETDIRNSASRIARGIDVRGEGGYVVAPPSVHPTGRVYVWRDEIPAGGLPQISETWAGLLAPQRTERPAASHPPPAPVPFDGVGTRYGVAALNGELARLSAAEIGARNDTLNAAGFAVGSLVGAGHLDLGRATVELVRVAYEIGLAENEIKATLDSALRAGLANPRRGAAA